MCGTTCVTLKSDKNPALLVRFGFH